jgi:hypothetical protein
MPPRATSRFRSAALRPEAETMAVPSAGSAATDRPRGLKAPHELLKVGGVLGRDHDVRALPRRELGHRPLVQQPAGGS